MDLISKIINAMLVEKSYRQAMRASSSSSPANFYNGGSGTFKKNQRKERKLSAKRKRR